MINLKIFLTYCITAKFEKQTHQKCDDGGCHKAKTAMQKKNKECLHMHGNFSFHVCLTKSFSL